MKAQLLWENQKFGREVILLKDVAMKDQWSKETRKEEQGSCIYEKEAKSISYFPVTLLVKETALHYLCWQK